MKKRFKSEGSVIAALDIGSNKVACFIARMIDAKGGFEVLGIGHHASGGVKNGTIVDLDKVETSIRHAVHAAENMAAESMKGYPLREVLVNVSGVHAGSQWQSADILMSGHEITENDLKKTLARAQERSEDAQYDVIHTIPLGYTIDGHSGVVDPVGMVGQNMLIDIHMVRAESSVLQNITSCVGHSHLDIAAFCLSSYASGLAVLVEDEMDLGATVIDMGAGVTSYAVFQSGNLLLSGAVPVGGQHVTNDIAKGLATGISDAERLKILYGSAIAAPNDEAELIDVPIVGESQAHSLNHVPRSILVGIIQPRLEEIFEVIRAQLDDSGLGPAMGRRVVLTGGASQMAGIRELAQHVMDRQVRVGRPVRVHGLPDAVSGPAFSTVSGLLTYINERDHEIPEDVKRQAESLSLFQRLRGWVRENW